MYSLIFTWAIFEEYLARSTPFYCVLFKSLPTRPPSVVERPMWGEGVSRDAAAAAANLADVARAYSGRRIDATGLCDKDGRLLTSVDVEFHPRAAFLGSLGDEHG